MEEQNSRRLVQQQNVDDILNEFLEYVVLRTELMKIVQAGGVGMAGDVVDDFRGQSEAVDAALEQKLRALFHRGASPQSGTGSGNVTKEG